MKKLLTGIAFFLVFSLACARLMPTPVVAPAESTVSATEAPATESVTGLEGLGGVPCPDSDFTCVTITVPLNHFDPDDSRTMDVVFAILPATGERKGMFVTATGGPGTAGLTSADGYTAAFDPAIPEHFDIVFSISAAWDNQAACNACKPRPRSILRVGIQVLLREKMRYWKRRAYFQMTV